MYKDLPVLKIDVIRGNDKTIQLRNIVVNNVTLDFTDINPRVQFKSIVDADITPVFDKTVDNGGMIVTNESITLLFAKETNKLQMGKYFGDLLVNINDKEVTIVRFDLYLSGVVTISD